MCPQVALKADSWFTRTMTDMTHKSQSINRVDWICMRNSVFVHNHMPFQSRCRPAYLAGYNTHCYQVAAEHWMTMVCQCETSYDSHTLPSKEEHVRTFHRSNLHTYIHTYIHIWEWMCRGVRAIIGSGHGDTNSNPGRDFAFHIEFGKDINPIIICPATGFPPQ